MKITVLTPTYNRAHTLSNLYNSLIKNKEYCDSFEWLVMDDGSTDDTETLIKTFIDEKQIDIKYFKQKNQGKMMALNNLLDKINGEITIECDSDDYFTDDCFKHVLDKWNKIVGDETIYGLAFLRVTPDGKALGKHFKREGQVSKVFDLYFKEGFTGDTCLAFKSSVRKQFKHRLENNETFATEGRMYHEIDKKYAGLKCFNIPGIVCEYQNDGYTKNIINFFKKAPFGHYHYYLEMFDFDMAKVPFKQRIHIIKHYILFSYLTRKSIKDVVKDVKGIFNKLLTTILVVPGYMVSKRKFGLK